LAIETPSWVRDAVFYQIFPDRFASSERVVKPGPLEPWDTPPTVHGFKGGDLLGVAEHLDHLQRMGVTAVYFNPVFQSASNHRYHTYDYMAVDPLLGGDGALRELIDACHQRGMKVVLDGVFNHASRGFWPFNHVLETGAASPYREWFYLDEEALAAGHPLRAYPLDPPTVDVSAPVDDRRKGEASLHDLGYRAWWDLPALPKLRTENPHMRQYLLDVAEYWLRFGIDGWRLDVAEEVPDDFWREFRARVKGVDPEAYIVAEIWTEKPQFLQGDMYDAFMNYPLAEAIISFVSGAHLDQSVVDQHFEYRANIRPEDGATFGRRLEHVFATYDPAITAVQLNLLGSHDTPRVRTVCGGDIASVRMATLVQMTVVGAPSIYYGDEIGLAGGHDPACRGAFPWDEAAWDQGLFDYTCGAIALRAANPVLRHGAFAVVAADGIAMAYRRSDENATVVVALNAGEEPRTLDLRLPDLAGRWLVAENWTGMDVLEHGGTRAVEVAADGGATVTLPARDGLVLRAAG
jgi:cyclomaltodextrinase / maltogenic alpha-amylase / neopullulanase